jgi:hypothetical protein
MITIKQLKKENKELKINVETYKGLFEHYKVMSKVSLKELKFLYLLLEVGNSTLNEIKEVTTDELIIQLIDIAQKRQVLDKRLHNRKLI